MEDLISFEDLVVQPCNSYFNLEKELHEVKSRLTLLEERLKYLEKPKNTFKKKRPVKQDTDLKEYEIIEKKIQNDYDRKIRLINRNKRREDNYKDSLESPDEIGKKWKVKEERKLLENAELSYNSTFNYVMVNNKEIDKLLLYYKVIINLKVDVDSYRFVELFLKYKIQIENLVFIGQCNYNLIPVMNYIIINNFKCKSIEIKKTFTYIIKIEIDKLQKYCDENKIELKVI